MINMVAESHKWYFGAIHFSLVSRILRLYYMCTGINTVSVLYINRLRAVIKSWLPIMYSTIF
jgi:hypothetical protein